MSLGKPADGREDTYDKGASLQVGEGIHSEMTNASKPWRAGSRMNDHIFSALQLCQLSD
jgi:hypothetical protein